MPLERTMMGSLTSSLENSTGAAHDVVKANRMLGNAQANRRGFAVLAAALALRRVERAALARVIGRLLMRHRMGALALQVLLRAETEIGLALSQQPFRMLAIEIEAIALTVGSVRPADIGAFIPVESHPLQVFEQLSFEALFAALDVGVLDAQHHHSALLAGEEPVEERGAGVADVQVAGG